MTAGLRIGMESGYALSALGRAIAELADPRPMLDEVGGRLETSTRQRFEAQQGPQRQPWPPSARARKVSGQTLVKTGRLRDSITHVVRGSGQHAELLVGTNVAYAAIHQFGGTIRQEARTQVLAFGKKGGFASRKSTRRRRAGAVRIAIAAIDARDIDMPARPYLGISDEDGRAVLRIARRHVSGAFS